MGGYMKIIFLDIDGVLNSVRYDCTKTESDGNIDKTRLPLLKELVDKTDAKIVLSSSWRIYWESDKAKCDSIGKDIDETFSKFGLTIYDKTPYLTTNDRAREIRMWLLSQKENIENFVILDDAFGGWGELSYNLVQTSALIGKGLEENHINAALKILNFKTP